MDSPIVPYGENSSDRSASKLFKIDLGNVQLPSYINDLKAIQNDIDRNKLDANNLTPKHYLLLGSTFNIYKSVEGRFNIIGGVHNFPDSHYVASQNKDMQLLKYILSKDAYKLDEFNRSYVFYLIFNPNEENVDKFLRVPENLSLKNDPIGQIDIFGLTFVHFWFLVGQKARIKRYLRSLLFIPKLFNSLKNELSILQLPTYAIAKFLPEEKKIIAMYAQCLRDSSVSEEKILKSIIVADNLDAILEIKSDFLPQNVDLFFQFSYINNAPKCFEWMFTKIKTNFNGLRPILLKRDPIDALHKAVELGLQINEELLQAAKDCQAFRCTKYLEEKLSH